MFFTQECQRVAVMGLGGVGKTQVALKFAYWAKENKPDYSIFWVAALSDAGFEQVYMEMAKKLPILKDNDEEPMKSVRRYLSSEEAGPWLLIVDNADDIDILLGSSDTPGGIIDYLPESERGLTLFTTRSRQVAVAIAGNDVVELCEMNLQEAESFLEKSLIQKDLLHDRAAMTKLLNELTYLPLAITQAAAYLNKNQVSLTEYLKLLQITEQDTIRLMSRQFHDNTRYKDSQNAVATTWLVSFDQIRKSDSVAADLLSFISRIEPKAIPWSILPSLGSEEQMVNAIGILRGYAFVVKRANDEMFDMHSLVHLATRIWIQRAGFGLQTMEAATRHLATVFPSDDYVNRSLWREYLPHAFKVLFGDDRVDIKERYELGYWTGRCLLVDGRIKEAIKCLRECYSWRKSHFPEEDPNRLGSQHELARAYEADGQTKKAIELLEHVVTIREKTLAKEHPSRLNSQHELARVYEADGQTKKAIELLKHVVTIREKTLAKEHPSRLNSQHELARVYEADGQTKKAIELLKHVVTIREKTLAKEHPSRLASQHELARAYKADGQTKKAIKLLEHVVVIQEKTLAKEHPSRLDSQHELARAYKADGQTKKAIKLLEHVVVIREKTLAEEHPSRLASQYVLANVYKADGQTKKAAELLEYVISIQEKTLTKKHPL
ncbi:P-loop containing nucleoside triphosphate hydrolase protein [Halenospora varia]|nr:P-loop containing nucleoside triphosphate hydrolase protein [Halenospora varia]